MNSSKLPSIDALALRLLLKRSISVLLVSLSCTKDVILMISHRSLTIFSVFCPCVLLMIQNCRFVEGFSVQHFIPPFQLLLSLALMFPSILRSIALEISPCTCCAYCIPCAPNRFHLDELSCTFVPSRVQSCILPYVVAFPRASSSIDIT